MASEGGVGQWVRAGAILCGLALLARPALDVVRIVLTDTLVSFGEFGSAVDADDVPALTRGSRSLLPPVRRMATRLLAIAPGPEADAALRERVRDSADPAVWGTALAHLVGVEDPEAEALRVARPEILDAAARSNSAAAREAAALSAVALGGAEQADRCASLTPDEDPDVRASAATCVGRIGSAEQAEALAGQIRQESDLTTLRAAAEAAVDRDDPAGQALYQAAFDRLEQLQQQLPIGALAGGRAPWCAAKLEALALNGPDQGTALKLLKGRPLSRPIAELCAGVYGRQPLPGVQEQGFDLVVGCEGIALAAFPGISHQAAEVLAAFNGWLATQGAVEPNATP